MNKKVKVTMALTNDVLRDNRVLREASALVMKNYEVTIVGMKSDQTEYNEIKDGINITRINPAPWGGTFNESFINIYKYMKYVFKYGNLTQKYLYDRLIEIPTDIYHSHDFNTLMPIYQAAKKTNNKFVYDSHELFIETINEIPLKYWYEKIFTNIVKFYIRIMEGRLIKKAAAVITVNSNIAQILSKKYKICLPAVIRNIPPYKLVTNKINWQSILKIPKKSKIILYQGGIGTSRGTPQLVNSMKYLDTEIHLVFLGYGKLIEELKKMSIDINKENNIHFHPAVNTDVLLNYTAGADMGLSLIEPTNLSKYYALPNKLFEYMMAGVPIMASDLPAMAEIINDSENGFLIKNLDPKNIAEKIEQALNSSELEMMKQNSLSKSKEIYNWEIESKILTQLYSSIEI